MSALRWQCLDDAAAVAALALQRILAAAERAIAERGAFRLVLAGGSTPLQVYRLLAGRKDIDVSRWRLYPGDERCLPVDHADRNSRMIDEAWLSHSPIPAEQIHWMPAELGAAQGAQAYEEVIAAALPFDLVLLGMGEDGHTASLFPGHEHPAEPLVVAVHGAPKPPPERISLNYRALNDCREMLVLVTGESKREAVRRWQAGESLPVAQLQCDNGVDVLLDRAALPA